MNKKIKEKVFIAIGHISVCWSHFHEKGVFNSSEAEKIGNELVIEIEKEIIKPKDVEHLITSLQKKHDSFLGTKGEEARQEFKRGLDWAIDSIKTALKKGE